MSSSPPFHIGTTHAANGGSGNNSSQSYSPMCPRHQEDLINAYEAEEERIINVLSRKLEQVCETITMNYHCDVAWKRIFHLLPPLSWNTFLPPIVLICC